jgi:hypothetical protein
MPSDLRRSDHLRLLLAPRLDSTRPNGHRDVDYPSGDVSGTLHGPRPDLHLFDVTDRDAPRTKFVLECRPVSGRKA